MSDLREVADRRENIHRDHASSRPLSEDYEFVGLRGEQEFSRLTGLDLDTEDRPGGDKGRDFIVPTEARPYTVDVKTARLAYNLIVERGKVRSDVYVLAGYQDFEDRVTFLGWEAGSKMRQRPVKDFGYGVINHYLPASRLNPMPRLLDWIGKATGSFAWVTCECGKQYLRARPDWTTCLRCELKVPA